MKRLFSEDDCQKAQVSYLEFRRETMRDLMFCAIPNAAKRSFRLAALLKALGLVSGAPDLIIWKHGRTVHIENKVKGRNPSDAQKAFGDALKALGHEYHVITAETPKDAVDQLEAILNWSAA